METDIVPALLDKIMYDFGNALNADGQIRKYLQKIRDGTVSLDEASLFARGLGDILADVLRKDLKQNILPDGRMYYNIAERIIRPMLRGNYNMANEAAKIAQTDMDRETGFDLNAIYGEWPEERVSSLIGAISEDGIEWEEVSRRMDEPVRNISQSFLDDFVKTNAAFRNRAGMKAMVVRKLHGGACRWCRNLAGTYEYPDVPEDVYRRHDNCRCTVTYRCGRRRQDVWTKQEWSTPGQMQHRRTVGLELMKRTREQAGKKEAELEEKF